MKNTQDITSPDQGFLYESDITTVTDTTGKAVKKFGDVEFPERKVWMQTYGCQMNMADSDRMLAHLNNLNFEYTKDQSEADLILFNTCAVRDKANQKFYSHLGEAKHRKAEEKKVVIGAAGCIAQTEGKELVSKYKHLDFTFGPDSIDQIPEMVFRTFAGDNKFSINAWDRSQDYSIETRVSNETPQAFVNIIKGCDKFCSYCIVPFTRGREKSRRIEHIVKDVQRLVEYSGVQEIMLLGQNVNSFGKKNGESLTELLYALEQIEGLELIRYTTSHPYDVSDELIEAHGKLKKLSNHLHLPVQSGSNTVLQRMLREYTKEHFLGLMDKLRKANPNIVISSDIIAGFPNETREEHEETADLLRKAKFDFIYSYAFSPRKGTKADRIEDVLTKDIRGQRLRELQKLQLEVQALERQKLVGKKMTLLVDGTSNMKGIKKWKGRTNCMRIVHFLPESDDQSILWNWVDVEITESTALSCQGKLLKIHGKKLTTEMLK